MPTARRPPDADAGIEAGSVPTSKSPYGLGSALSEATADRGILYLWGATVRHGGRSKPKMARAPLGRYDRYLDHSILREGVFAINGCADCNRHLLHKRSQMDFASY
jgi:hypothetical protein